MKYFLRLLQVSSDKEGLHRILSVSFILFLSLVYHDMSAQEFERQVFSTSGLTGTINGNYFSTTIGEDVMGTRIGTVPFLIMGFQQPILDGILASTNIHLTGQWEFGKAILRWQLETPVEEGVFILERAHALPDYRPIQQVNITDNTQYSFTDGTVERSNHQHWFYRVRHVMPDGAMTYSNPVELTLADQTRLSIYPNPVQTHLYIQGVTEEKVEVKLFNSLGQIVKVPISKDRTLLTVELAGLTSGTYMLQLVGRFTNYVQRVMVE